MSAQPWARMCPVSEPEFSLGFPAGREIVANPGPSVPYAVLARSVVRRSGRPVVPVGNLPPDASLVGLVCQAVVGAAP
ncbi:hypothetical protein [Micromonospora sp. DT233]|uniref:hypothetical protein n=1 Tax=Micromonospora sp. DT233 TaxID=3393432 RepID=UPI003CF64B02